VVRRTHVTLDRVFSPRTRGAATRAGKKGFFVGLVDLLGLERGFPRDGQVPWTPPGDSQPSRLCSRIGQAPRRGQGHSFRGGRSPSAVDREWTQTPCRKLAKYGKGSWQTKKRRSCPGRDAMSRGLGWAQHARPGDWSAPPPPGGQDTGAVTTGKVPARPAQFAVEHDSRPAADFQVTKTPATIPGLDVPPRGTRCSSGRAGCSAFVGRLGRTAARVQGQPMP